jgi:putative PIN family toxin of toxin-antitoxin system
LDANVLVRAAMSPGGPAAVLQSLLLQPEHELVASTWLLHELEDVLGRPRLRAYHKFNDARIRQIVLQLDSFAARVVIGSPPSVIVENDPGDDPVVLTAMAGEADVICTLDKHLHAASVSAFCAQNGIRILTDVELLSELKPT